MGKNLEIHCSTQDTPLRVDVVPLSPSVKAQGLKARQPLSGGLPWAGLAPRPWLLSPAGPSLAWGVSSPALVGLSYSRDRWRVPRQGAEVGPAGSGGGGSLCFHDTKRLLMGCGLHRDWVPGRAVHVDWAATTPCHGAGEELAGAV